MAEKTVPRKSSKRKTLSQMYKQTEERLKAAESVDSGRHKPGHLSLVK